MEINPKDDISASDISGSLEKAIECILPLFLAEVKSRASLNLFTQSTPIFDFDQQCYLPEFSVNHLVL